MGNGKLCEKEMVGYVYIETVGMVKARKDEFCLPA